MCSKERDPQKATLVKAVPTANNGWTELVSLRKTKRDGDIKIWFEFQRVIYTLDDDSKKFRTIIFDCNRPMKYFKTSSGFQNEEELVSAAHSFGNNKTEMVIPQFWDLFMERAPFFVFQVLSWCHSLVKFEDDLVGDPLEKACLNWCGWTLTKADAVVPPSKATKLPGMRVFHRYRFSSAMKRMTVIAGYHTIGSQDSNLLVAVKGAPEVLRNMYKSVPEDYDETYMHLTRQGSRVLALGIRDMPGLKQSEIRNKTREWFEEDLTFAGFVVISCPLKPDTKAMIKEIIESSHKVVMITGDDPLTACHVAKVLKFVKNKLETLILDFPSDGKEWFWKTVDDSVSYDFIPSKPTEFFKKHEFCLTGAACAHLEVTNKDFLRKLLANVRVFARMAPKQKESVINEFKALGFNTAMCGDGTNDAGALKHAHVGVALLSHLYDATKAEQKEKEKKEKMDEARRLYREVNAPAGLPPGVQRTVDGPPGMHRPPPPPAVANAQRKLELLMKELEEEEKATVVKLGDASIAAPFTSKYTEATPIRFRSEVAFAIRLLLFFSLIPAADASCLDYKAMSFALGTCNLILIIVIVALLWIWRYADVAEDNQTRTHEPEECNSAETDRGDAGHEVGHRTSYERVPRKFLDELIDADCESAKFLHLNLEDLDIVDLGRQNSQMLLYYLNRYLRLDISEIASLFGSSAAKLAEKSVAEGAEKLDYLLSHGIHPRTFFRTLEASAKSPSYYKSGYMKKLERLGLVSTTSTQPTLRPPPDDHEKGVRETRSGKAPTTYVAAEKRPIFVRKIEGHAIFQELEMVEREEYFDFAGIDKETSFGYGTIRNIPRQYRLALIPLIYDPLRWTPANHLQPHH